MNFFFACLKSQADKNDEIKGNKISVQTREEKITANTKAAHNCFNDALPKAKNDIAEALKNLQVEFEALQAKITEAQKKPNFNPYDFEIEIFTIKEHKCEQQLNDLYNTAQKARDKIVEQKNYLSKDSAESKELSKQIEAMDQLLDNLCKNPITNFANKIEHYAQEIGIKATHSAVLVP